MVRPSSTCRRSLPLWQSSRSAGGRTTLPIFRSTALGDARTKVVEFLLGLDVFETNVARNRLNAESVEIDTDWRKVIEELRRD